MSRKKVLALILAGGAGGRLDVLTDARAKPAVPFAGTYRLIDFALSNCMHSELSDVWIVEQYEPHLLNEHLANGRPWDLDRTYGGLRILPPYEGSGDGGFAQGNADAIFQHLDALRAFDPDILVVMSADHVYKLDLRDAIDAHAAAVADVTMVTTLVPEGESASRFGTVKVDGEGRVTEFEYKPKRPTSDVVTTEVFVYTARALWAAIDELTGGTRGARKLKDWGDELLPRMVAGGGAREFRMDGYWRDVGVVESYWRAHMDLLDDDRDGALDLDDDRWPILTYGAQRLPARLYKTARVDNSLISPGCQIAGRVERSVLGPGVVVERGATVSDSVVFADATIESGARVTHAIVDEQVRVRANAVVGAGAESGAGAGKSRNAGRAAASKRTIALVGLGAEIAPGARVAAGARVKPGALRRK